MNKTAKQFTSKTDFFNAVMELKKNPDKYNKRTMTKQAKMLSDAINGTIVDSSINEIFQCAGVQRIPLRGKNAIDPYTSTSKAKMRALCSALIRQMDVISEITGTRIPVDKTIIAIAKDVPAHEIREIIENEE